MIPNIYPKRISQSVFIDNSLTQKPQKAVESLIRIMSSVPGYQLRLRQDYSKGVVHMQLETVGLTFDTYNKTYHDVYGIQEVPITSNKKAYINALRKMIRHPFSDPIMTETGTVAMQKPVTTMRVSFIRRILSKIFGI